MEILFTFKFCKNNKTAIGINNVNDIVNNKLIGIKFVQVKNRETIRR